MKLIKKAALYSALIGSLIFGGNALAQGGNLEKRIDTNSISREQVQKSPWKIFHKKDVYRNELFDQLETDTSGMVSRGFNKSLKIMSQSGTYVNPVPKTKINALVEQFGDSIDKDIRLSASLQILLKDDSSYTVIEQFLKDGGKIKAESTSGKYTPNPLTMAVDTTGSLFDIEKILYHESLHYVFDKTNSVLWESHDGGGADHFAIFPLQDRLKIIQQIRHKQIPLSDKNNVGLYSFTKGVKIGKKIKEYINDNDLKGLNHYINSKRFGKEYVKASMMIPMISNEYYDQHPEEREKSYKLTDGQIEDIAFLNAINGNIIKQSINIGISIASKNSMKITEAFETDEFKNEFQRFLSQYTKKLEGLDAASYKAANLASK